ncbi:tyrosinase family protein [Ensifer sp. ENS04]|uniref:tyrosinase family protein n=1 Tax=Ensifer sp. ENS04 TaxID=2769281 RepID=UPI00178007D9|nr:tyrosinase family protein [Ensifer sp. ENS04]MBD9541445.1 tyrosinase family protein [Ensifer sp. ENS04]
MRNSDLGRRDFTKLAVGGGIIVSLASGISLGKALAGTPARVRYDVNDAVKGPEVTDRYRAAVRALKALDAADSRSWLNLSAVHRNFCPHGNWYFLPWHRAYLLAFEDICREVANDKDFTLPYWNWTDFRQLPPGFVDEKLADGTENTLYHAARVMKGNDTLSTILNQFGTDAETIFGAGNITDILGKKTFQEFGSFKPTAQTDTAKSWQRARGSKTALESGPHDFLHGIVGGDMGNPQISPQDPIFYLHHCNLDRLWAHWSRLGRQPEPDALWTDFIYEANFPKADGQAGGHVRNSDLIDAEALGYQYDSLASLPVETSAARPILQLDALATKNWSAPLATGAVSQLQLGLSESVRERVQSVVEAQSSEKRLFLFLNGVSKPRDTRMKVRVFLNCDYLTPLTPVDDPHYAASFTFFVADHGMDAHADHESQSFAFDVTEVARKLAITGARSQDELTVQLLPLGFDGKPMEDNEFKVESIKIATI